MSSKTLFAVVMEIPPEERHEKPVLILVDYQPTQDKALDLASAAFGVDTSHVDESRDWPRIEVGHVAGINVCVVQASPERLALFN